MPDFSNLPEVLNLAVGGVPVALAIWLTVAALKAVGMVKPGPAGDEGGPARKANVIVGLVYGSLWTARVVFEQPAGELTPTLVIDTVFVALIGSLGAALLHTASEPLTAKLAGLMGSRPRD